MRTFSRKVKKSSVSMQGRRHAGRKIMLPSLNHSLVSSVNSSVKLRSSLRDVQPGTLGLRDSKNSRSFMRPKGSVSTIKSIDSRSINKAEIRQLSSVLKKASHLSRQDDSREFFLPKEAYGLFEKRLSVCRRSWDSQSPPKRDARPVHKARKITKF